jgi:hypothetical protein
MISVHLHHIQEHSNLPLCKMPGLNSETSPALLCSISGLNTYDIHYISYYSLQNIFLFISNRIEWWFFTHLQSDQLVINLQFLRDKISTNCSFRLLTILVIYISEKLLTAQQNVSAGRKNTNGKHHGLLSKTSNVSVFLSLALHYNSSLVSKTWHCIPRKALLWCFSCQTCA